MVLRPFQHCTGHITMSSWEGRGNQYIQLPTNGKQLPAFPLETVLGTEPRPQKWEARVLPLCHRAPYTGQIRLALYNKQYVSLAIPLTKWYGRAYRTTHRLCSLVHPVFSYLCASFYILFNHPRSILGQGVQ